MANKIRRVALFLALVASPVAMIGTADAASPATGLVHISEINGPHVDCRVGYYKNASGNCVKRPTPGPTRPSGATARCKDGTYSFSQHRKGTCSGHRGVRVWY